MPKASAPHQTSTPTSPTHITMEDPPKAESQISITAEVWKLLSHAVLDISSQASGSYTPKRLTSAALGDPSSPRAEDPPKALNTSSQASPQAAIPDITKPINQTTPPTKNPGADAGDLPEEVILLQEEMNRTMGHLLMTRTSLDTHQQKQVSDFEMALHQNEAEATKAIKQAKAHCGATIREVEACHTTHIREAEANCASIIRETEANCASIITEAEARCTADIRKVESHCVEHACTIQQSHAEDMQCLEIEAMEGEGRDCHSFLAACGTALQACPQEPMGSLGVLH